MYISTRLRQIERDDTCTNNIEIPMRKSRLLSNFRILDNTRSDFRRWPARRVKKIFVTSVTPDVDRLGRKKQTHRFQDVYNERRVYFSIVLASFIPVLWIRITNNIFSGPSK